jgi:hypothetical protein
LRIGATAAAAAAAAAAAMPQEAGDVAKKPFHKIICLRPVVGNGPRLHLEVRFALSAESFFPPMGQVSVIIVVAVGRIGKYKVHRSVSQLRNDFACVRAVDRDSPGLVVRLHFITGIFASVSLFQAPVLIQACPTD